MKRPEQLLFFVCAAVLGLLVLDYFIVEDEFKVYERQTITSDFPFFEESPMVVTSEQDATLLANTSIDPFSLGARKIIKRKPKKPVDTTGKPKPPVEKPKPLPKPTEVTITPKPKPPPPKPRVVPFEFVGISKNGRHLNAPVVIMRLKETEDAPFVEVSPGEAIDGYVLKSIKGEVVIVVDPDGKELKFDNGQLID